MLKAVVVSTDPVGSNFLQARLQQTGLAQPVGEWLPSIGIQPAPGEAVPDVILLDLVGAPEPYFLFAAHLRQLFPSIRIIACAAMEWPDPQILLHAMRSGVQEFLPKPVEVGALRDVLSRYAKETETSNAPLAQKLIAVMGSKGGVGTSTVAVNLAVQLRQLTNKRVALLDFARPLGHICLMLNLQPRFSLRDAVENVDRLDPHFFGGLLAHHKTGIEVLAGTSHAEEWSKLPVAALARVVGVAHADFDYLVLDGGVLDPSEWNAILRPARAILLVAETSLISLWSLERHFAAINAAGIDSRRVQIIVNRWRRHDEEALENVEANLKRPIDVRLPNDHRQVSDAVTMGMPLSGSANNALVTGFRQLAMDLASLDSGSIAARTGSRDRLASVR